MFYFSDYKIEKITVDALDYCDLSCNNCFIKKNKKNNFFSFKLFKKLVDELIKDNDKSIEINLSGGEPTISPDFLKIIKYANKKKVRINVFTNGIKIIDYIDEIILNPLNSLMFSIDGLQKAHDANRGFGSFKKTTNNIKKIIKIKKELNLMYPKININSLISKLNANSFYKTVKLANELKCDNLFFSLVQWIDNESIVKHKNELVDRFGIYGTRAKNMENMKHENGLLSDFKIKNIFDKISKIKKEKSNIPIYFFPDFKNLEEYKKWFSSGIYKIDKCDNVFKQIRIDSFGNVSAGCSTSLFTIGDFSKNSLNSVLNGEKSKLFIKEIKSSGLFYACSRCCRRPNNSHAI